MKSNLLCFINPMLGSMIVQGKVSFLLYYQMNFTPIQEALYGKNPELRLLGDSPSSAIAPTHLKFSRRCTPNRKVSIYTLLDQCPAAECGPNAKWKNWHYPAIYPTCIGDIRTSELAQQNSDSSHLFSQRTQHHNKAQLKYTDETAMPHHPPDAFSELQAVQNRQPEQDALSCDIRLGFRRDMKGVQQ